MQTVITWLGILSRLGQKAGPYLVLEMLLPGGTLFALVLFLYRRGKPGIDGGARRAVAVAMCTLASVCEQRIWVPASIRLHPRRYSIMRCES
jgi:hypothetical protein